MKWRDDEALRLGPDVVQRLIPHRRPLLLVDRVDGFRAGPQPVLWAHRHITANEEVFAGHFPGLGLWPGVYTQEGLGQSALLLSVILHLVTAREQGGGTAAEVLEALRELDPARWLRSGARRATWLDELPPPDPRSGMAGQVELKYLAPVFAGSLLRYRVARSHTFATFARFDVEAEVDGTAVARGTITGVLGPVFGPT
jgi:3-hydroxyacyl-[acyl-carrier-protein] dehydratase